MGVWGFFEAEWPLLLCILIVASCVAAAISVVRKFEAPFLRKRFHLGEVGPPSEIASLYANDLYKCFDGRLHWAWLAAFRLLTFVYLLGVQMYDISLHGLKAYIFYTQWTFTLLIVYFGLASFLSVREFWNTKKDDSVDEEVQAGATLITENKTKDQKLHRSLVSGRIGYATIITFQVATVASLFTDAIYWCILVPLLPDRYEFNFINMNMHAVNALFLFCEFCANSLPFPWFRGAYFVFWTGAYVLFQWIIHAGGFIRWWPYPFLEVHTPYAPGWYIALAVAHLIVFLFCLALARAKKTLGRLLSQMFT